MHFTCATSGDTENIRLAIVRIFSSQWTYSELP
jgi:hypothetical protein